MHVIFLTLNTKVSSLISQALNLPWPKTQAVKYYFFLSNISRGCSRTRKKDMKNNNH